MLNNRMLLLALALVVAVNAFVLAGVAYNRSGAPEARLLLSEREFNLYHYDSDENTGVALHLDWNNNHSEDWFDSERLREIGFDVAALQAAESDWQSFSRQLPRRAYVVLEFEGAAWQQWLDEQRQEIAKIEQEMATDAAARQRQAARIARLREGMLQQSRLFAVDVGASPEALRQRYPERSRYTIAPAEVLADSRKMKGMPRLHGWIRDLLVEDLQVPLAQQSPLKGLPERPYWASYDNDDTEVHDWQPWYTVEVAWGKRFEPWIEAITLTDAGRASAAAPARD